ncbi:MAG: hypothetical protein JSV64_07355 [Candidatus Bathyarchaeota archaeon]|nr:MAG: hypothetical protein JSV64_07355 [Candidatus Bathyarchaeota archaeon]
MRSEARVSLVYERERDAEAVFRAVSPDNRVVPIGLSIQTRRRNSKVYTSIHCEKSLETLLSTLDDLLACVSVAERAFELAKTAVR